MEAGLSSGNLGFVRCLMLMRWLFDAEDFRLALLPTVHPLQHLFVPPDIQRPNCTRGLTAPPTQAGITSASVPALPPAALLHPGRPWPANGARLQRAGGWDE